MTEREEAAYTRGHRRAWLSVLQQCCRELGYEDVEIRKASWISEREDAIATLRRICDDIGDNEWPNDLHLSDIIEKHLERHLRT